MGKYVGKKGLEKDRFRLKLNKKVTSVVYDEQRPDLAVKALRFEDGTQTKEHQPEDVDYVFCPGEAVGTLDNLGFKEPMYAGFAGASLYLDVPVTAEELDKLPPLNHCMEVHGPGVVLAWQARVRDGKVFLGGAGTKAYCEKAVPTIHDAFAKNRNLLQLNMFNDVLPWVVSRALGRDTQGEKLTQEDMTILEGKGIATRWVGRRAVAYDGFPTLGTVYHDGRIVSNARTTTHLGSGGGSFSLITSLVSRYALNPEGYRKMLMDLGFDEEFLADVLSYADSRRTVLKNKKKRVSVEASLIR